MNITVDKRLIDLLNYTGHPFLKTDTMEWGSITAVSISLDCQEGVQSEIETMINGYTDDYDDIDYFFKNCKILDINSLNDSNYIDLGKLGESN